MKILIIGGGGREYRLVKKLAQEPDVKKIWVAPGNGGTWEYAENVSIEATDIASLHAFALRRKPDLTVVGPEDPLALGIVDDFRQYDLPIFGPTQHATRLESSKALAKRWMWEEGIPTAPFDVYHDYDKAMTHVMRRSLPMVVKASMLAAGKGVVVCRTRDQALAALAYVAELYAQKRRRDFCVVIENFVPGSEENELSLFTLTDGDTLLTLEPAQDHKALYMNPDGTTGPNTGGMAAHSPAAWADVNFIRGAEQKIILPILKRCAEKSPFTGCLFTGLKGETVLEFNARFGDPETQPLLARLRSLLLPYLMACTNRTLHMMPAPVWDPRPCAYLVVAAAGYPSEYKKHMLIEGLIEARDAAPGVEIIHAGTVLGDDKKLYTNGGRVLGIQAFADTLEQAYRHAERAAEHIRFGGSREQVYFRRGIMPAAV